VIERPTEAKRDEARQRERGEKERPQENGENKRKRDRKGARERAREGISRNPISMREEEKKSHVTKKIPFQRERGQIHFNE